MLWLVKCGRLGCCVVAVVDADRVLAVADALLWKDAPPVEFSLSFFLFFIPIPRTTLALPPSSNSDPGSHSGPSPPCRLLLYVPFFFITRSECLR